MKKRGPNGHLAEVTAKRGACPDSMQCHPQPTRSLYAGPICPPSARWHQRSGGHPKRQRPSIRPARNGPTNPQSRLAARGQKIHSPRRAMTCAQNRGSRDTLPMFPPPNPIVQNALQWPPRKSPIPRSARGMKWSSATGPCLGHHSTGSRTAGPIERFSLLANQAMTCGHVSDPLQGPAFAGSLCATTIAFDGRTSRDRSPRVETHPCPLASAWTGPAMPGPTCRALENANASTTDPTKAIPNGCPPDNPTNRATCSWVKCTCAIFAFPGG